jgi:hypothetical protein
MIRYSQRCAATKPLLTVERRCPNRARFGPYCRTHALSLGYAVPVTRIALMTLMSQVVASKNPTSAIAELTESAFEVLARKDQP